MLLVRPERKIFYIDVGNIPPEDVEQYMQRVMTQMKRNQILDSTTGRVDLRYNPLSVDEDYFIPVRGGASNTKIEGLPGGAFTSSIEDVKYLRDKLFAALKVPMSYLIRGDGASEDKSTLAQKDIRFARTIQRLQRVIIGELEKVGIIHLYTLGFRGPDLISFKLSLNNPSKLQHFKNSIIGNQILMLLLLHPKVSSLNVGFRLIYLVFLTNRLSRSKEKCILIVNLLHR